MSSGEGFAAKATGVLAGGIGGGIVGAGAPQTSQFAGAAAAGAASSVVGQVLGSIGTGLQDGSLDFAAPTVSGTSVQAGEVKVDAVTALLGAVGSGAGAKISKDIAESTAQKIIGNTVQSAGQPTKAAVVVGAAAEGAISGAAERAGPTVSEVLERGRDAASGIKERFVEGR